MLLENTEFLKYSYGIFKHENDHLPLFLARNTLYFELTSDSI